MCIQSSLQSKRPYCKGCYCQIISDRVYFTTSRNANSETVSFAKELAKTLLNSEFLHRSQKPIEKIIKDARYKGFKFLGILEEDNNKTSFLKIIKITETDWHDFKKMPFSESLISEIEKMGLE